MEEQIIYTTKYALLTSDKYIELNNQISKAFGYSEGKSTARYTTNTPEIYNNLCIMIITSEVQEKYSDLLEEIELLDTKPITDIEITNI